MRQQFGADVFNDVKACALNAPRVLHRQHVETVRRALQVDLVDRNQLNGAVAHVDVRIEIAHRKQGVAQPGQVVANVGLGQAVAPVHVMAMHFKHHEGLVFLQGFVGTQQGTVFGAFDVELDQADGGFVLGAVVVDADGVECVFVVGAGADGVGEGIESVELQAHIAV